MPLSASTPSRLFRSMATRCPHTVWMTQQVCAGMSHNRTRCSSSFFCKNCSLFASRHNGVGTRLHASGAPPQGRRTQPARRHIVAALDLSRLTSLRSSPQRRQLRSFLPPPRPPRSPACSPTVRRYWIPSRGPALLWWTGVARSKTLGGGERVNEPLSPEAPPRPSWRCGVSLTATSLVPSGPGAAANGLVAARANVRVVVRSSVRHSAGVESSTATRWRTAVRRTGLDNPPYQFPSCFVPVVVASWWGGSV